VVGGDNYINADAILGRRGERITSDKWKRKNQQSLKPVGGGGGGKGRFVGRPGKRVVHRGEGAGPGNVHTKKKSEGRPRKMGHLAGGGKNLGPKRHKNIRPNMAEHPETEAESGLSEKKKK